MARMTSGGGASSRSTGAAICVDRLSRRRGRYSDAEASRWTAHGGVRRLGGQCGARPGARQLPQAVPRRVRRRQANADRLRRTAVHHRPRGPGPLEALEALEASEFAWSRRTRRRPAYPALRPARERRFRFRNSRGDEFERLLSLAAGGVYNTLPSAAARSTLTATSARPP